ncbi:MAG: preprotein translocase subunit SecG [Proteobacteria bacterium]|nr:preprotein translocase subunit SecG [Pseudomonadota bacterium]
MQNVLLTIHLIIAFCLICIVLIQKSEGGGLGVGGGGSGSGSGTMAGRPGIGALGKITWVLGAAFVITSITLTVLAAQKFNTNSVLDNIELMQDLNKSDTLDGAILPTLDGSAPLTPPRADK